MGAASALLLAALALVTPPPEAVSGGAFRDCATCPAIVRVAAGTFVMGGDGGEDGRFEGPKHKVTLAYAFGMGQTEVTNAQYGAFIADTGYGAPGPCRTLKGTTFSPDEAATWRTPGQGMAAAADEPVVCVSWKDATAYAGWLSKKTGKTYRLPSEAEWEYAARAGGAATFPWGEDQERACTFGNLYDAKAASLSLGWKALACDDGYAHLAPVGRYQPNAFGLYDMIGNAWEWTQDCYVTPYPPTPVDGSAIDPPQGQPCARRSVRGAGWMTRADRGRSSFRGRDPEDARYNYFGFRLVRVLDRGA